MSDGVTTFKELPLGDAANPTRFSFKGRNYTKVSYNKARCDERRDGEGPTRFRDEDEVEPEIKPSHPSRSPAAEADKKESAKPAGKPTFKAEPLTPAAPKPPAKTDEKKEPAAEADKK